MTAQSFVVEGVAKPRPARRVGGTSEEAAGAIFKAVRCAMAVGQCAAIGGMFEAARGDV